jgi:hypothetical protein
VELHQRYRFRKWILTCILTTASQPYPICTIDAKGYYDYNGCSERSDASYNNKSALVISSTEEIVRGLPGWGVIRFIWDFLYCILKKSFESIIKWPFIICYEQSSVVFPLLAVNGNSSARISGPIPRVISFVTTQRCPQAD